MANTLLTADLIASLGVELLRRQLTLLRTVSVIPGDEYDGPSGGSLRLRVPQPRAARKQTAGDLIVLDDIDEVSVTVSVSHLYNGAPLTDEDLNLKIEDFGKQVAAPMTSAVAVGAENEIASVMNDLGIDLDVDLDTPAEVKAAVLEARANLTRAGAPLGGRWLAVSPELATPILSLDEVSRVDASGSPSALRDAIIGKLYGFTVVESAGLDEGRGLAYHSSGFGAAVRPPAPAAGADSSTVAIDGIGLRVVRDFDVSHLSEVAVASTFAGAAAVYEDGDGDGGGTERPRVVTIGSGGS